MRDMARKRAFRVGRSRTGPGLFATAPIKKGAFIVEYKGRKLTNEQADKLEARGNRYLYEINSRWSIDGTSQKNLGRYSNHSCRPNARIHTIGHKVIIRALKNIKPGAETYNYGRDYLTNVITRRGCTPSYDSIKDRRSRNCGGVRDLRASGGPADTAIGHGQHGRAGQSRLVSLRLVHPVVDLAAGKCAPRKAATAHHRIGLSGGSAPA
jgi:hypothetical protein